MNKQLKIYDSPVLVAFERDLSAVYTSGWPDFDDSEWPDVDAVSKSKSIQDASSSFDYNKFTSPSSNQGVSGGVADYNPFSE